MCQKEECKYICIYEMDDYGFKLYIHYDLCYNPILIEYVKNGNSLGKFYSK